ncbi:MAG: hypothetical protein NTW96_00275 [Planctomycetia bacterium]|nr:hypothetical protein [Planctomycetia bacterium]
MKEAEHHAQKIEDCYRQAGTAGYGQALYHWNQLDQLIFRAYSSKNDKDDTVVIGAIKERVEPMMNEMKKGASEQADS